MIQKIVFFFELRSFGVSTWWARKTSVPVNKVRLFFIYGTIVGLGSPVILYLIMAFILKQKHIFKFQSKSSSIWEL
jgi:phage shock protein PspC (stress-responsive transcriptional regulator)